ncbi:MAG: pentapeptide repeat-containing protein [Dehalococcoidia bacterium]|nr:pentapeptide repeat-containing protein [Dehalococcoidia bacterium]
MPNREDIQLLLKGRESWDRRREQQKTEWIPDLSQADVTTLLEEAGRVTSDGKFDLRGYDLSTADFSGAILNQVDLSEASLSYSYFAEARLDQANLTDAVCQWTRFDGAQLHASKLINADLENARLANAMLREADLTDAYCHMTDFRNADLTNGKLRRAQLISAILIGANFSGCELWRAIILSKPEPMWQHREVSGIENIRVESV